MNDRFARHELIPGWRQDALAGATVVVLGVGALGNETARLLAMAGVGGLVLCDPDVVSASNLSRCALFRAGDVGAPKVEAARRGLAGLAPGTRVTPRRAALDTGVGLAELRDASLVVGCLDSVAARVQLAGRCGLAGVGWLDGGTGPWGGEARRFTPGGACYGCLAGHAGRAVLDDPVGCGALAVQAPAGASAPVTALVGAWLATEGVRLLCGLPPGPEVVVFDAETGARPVGVRRSADCPLHEPIPAGSVTPIGLSRAATAGEVLAAAAGPGEDVLTWNGFGAGPMPGRAGRVVTRLGAADPRATLRSLGVAPGRSCRWPAATASATSATSSSRPARRRTGRARRRRPTDRE
ncbi:HesA/MoeB/ThiF family protein [Thermocatellispora tengchongensis]|uniref:HesA/MoeB/ThiF family protein n=1 Tax=Thermocatellispora tengchongensis TaxID=1073253 RepID=UPI0036326A35